MLINTIKAAIVNIRHYSGDVLDLWVEINNSDGTPYSLAGKDLLMQIKKKKTSTVSLAELTSPSELGFSGTNDNELVCNKVISLPGGTYYYDVQNTTDHVTLLKGEFEEEYDVTRIEPTTTAAP